MFNIMENAKASDCNRVRHQALYKVKTPPWKDAFRQRCFERLRSNRSKLLDKFRNMAVVDEVMKEEWQSLADIDKTLPTMFESSDDNELNEYLSIFEEIQNELIEEERKILEEYYAVAESESINSTLDWLEKEEIICPICQKNCLHQNVSVIFCRCGFRIDTQQDGFTLQNFKTQLHEGIESHEKMCSSPPSFSLLEYCSISNLAITCEACSFMYIVI